MKEYSFSDELLSRLSNAVATQLGLNFPKDKWRDLERGIRSAFGETGEIESIESFLLNPSTHKKLKAIASCLTIGETYFFRDNKLFEALEKSVLPDLISIKRAHGCTLRIWSAGCSSGEEPYSISILLRKLIPDYEKWNITLLATDINTDFLNKMKSGVYGKWSFREVPQEIIKTYFSKVSIDRFSINDDIRKIVMPAYLNLAEDSFPSLHSNTNAMDIIICRNVLMYFTQEVTSKVVDRFYRCLTEDGILIVGPTETSQTIFSKFKTVQHPGVTIYKKEKECKSKLAIEEFNNELFFSEIKTQIIKDTLDLSEWVPQSLATPFESSRIGNEASSIQPPESKSEHHEIYQESLSLYKQGFYEEALKKLSKDFQVNYNDPEVHALLGRIYANMGKLREAFMCCQKAISLDKLNPVYHYLMAAVLLEQKRLNDAIISLQRVLYLDQNFILAHLTMGNILSGLGRINEASKSFQNTLVLLKQFDAESVIPETEGITAKQLIDIILAMDS